jgi:hypothetical protein
MTYLSAELFVGKKRNDSTQTTMKPIITFLLVSLFLLACQGGDSTQLVITDNKYSVTLPSFLEKAGTTLNEDASLQYLLPENINSRSASHS